MSLNPSIRALLHALLGGRPMLRVGDREVIALNQPCKFGQYLDCFGRLWLAKSRWGVLRMREWRTWEEKEADAKSQESR